MIQKSFFDVTPEKILEKMMSCTCGRSPTGKCVGWHNLSEEDYQNKKIDWETKQKSPEDAA
jgi:hypothetical protein